jgi:hypothetical protein
VIEDVKHEAINGDMDRADVWNIGVGAPIASSADLEMTIDLRRFGINSCPHEHHAVLLIDIEQMGTTRHQ